MQSLGWYLRRLRSMSAAEIAWRVRNLLRDQADLVRIPAGLVPGLPDRAQVPYADFEPGYRCSPVHRANWEGRDSQPQADWRDGLRRRARPILRNRLSYFDLHEVDHGDPFNWHRDHSAGIDAPLRLSVLTDYRKFAVFGDCKLVWEPNRHHQLVVLARAWVATGNEDYAHKVTELLRSWIDANPFGYGMNWKSPLELGVRLINWVWTIDLLRDSAAFDDRLWSDIQRTVYRSLWDMQRKFSRGSSANNHLVGEAAGVFIGACYFHWLPHASAWATQSQAVLEREIERQTYPDGCGREHAFGYQFFVIQFFTLCLTAGDACGRPFSRRYRQRLHAMYRFLRELSADTGHPPNAGDADDGYVLDLGELPNDPAGLLAVGAVIFDDPTLRSGRASETVFWTTGISEQPLADRPLSPTSVSYVDSGYHLLRSSRMSVFFDCAELGFGPIAAHGHADCLSVCLGIDGEPVLVDAGTYDYFSYPEWREYFRETRAHNTAEVDGQSQSQMLGPFLWGRRAGALLVQWVDDDRRTTATGEHDGYRRLADPLLHRRRLDLDKIANSLRITDTFATSGRHEARIHFHLHPDCQVRQPSGTGVEIRRGDITLELVCNGGHMRSIRADDENRLGWISPGYHRRDASTCLQLILPIDGETAVETTVTIR